jgi:hypothetical protein
VAVAWRGRVLGRGMAGRPGLELQVPRSQATRLAALLAERKDAFPDP